MKSLKYIAKATQGRPLKSEESIHWTFSSLLLPLLCTPFSSLSSASRLTAGWYFGITAWHCAKRHAWLQMINMQHKTRLVIIHSGWKGWRMGRRFFSFSLHCSGEEHAQRDPSKNFCSIHPMKGTGMQPPAAAPFARSISRPNGLTDSSGPVVTTYGASYMASTRRPVSSVHSGRKWAQRPRGLCLGAWT